MFHYICDTAFSCFSKFSHSFFPESNFLQPPPPRKLFLENYLLWPLALNLLLCKELLGLHYLLSIWTLMFYCHFKLNTLEQLTGFLVKLVLILFLLFLLSPQHYHWYLTSSHIPKLPCLVYVTFKTMPIYLLSQVPNSSTLKKSFISPASITWDKICKVTLSKNNFKKWNPMFTMTATTTTTATKSCHHALPLPIQICPAFNHLINFLKIITIQNNASFKFQCLPISYNNC